MPRICQVVNEIILFYLRIYFYRLKSFPRIDLFNQLVSSRLKDIMLSTGEAFQPEFAEPITNLTVPVGRDATFKCLVQNLGGYRVSQIKDQKF